MRIDESVFNKLDEVFVIEYTSGDRYQGELKGGQRHGIGMFVYKKTGKRVIGNWINNFMEKDGVRHPLEQAGVLLPLGVTSWAPDEV